jgi:hypothetical protein
MDTVGAGKAKASNLQNNSDGELRRGADDLTAPPRKS